MYFKQLFASHCDKNSNNFRFDCVSEERCDEKNFPEPPSDSKSFGSSCETKICAANNDNVDNVDNVDNDIDDADKNDNDAVVEYTSIKV